MTFVKKKISSSISIIRETDGSVSIGVSGTDGAYSFALNYEESDALRDELSPPAWLDATFVEVQPGEPSSYFMSKIEDGDWVDQFGLKLQASSVRESLRGVDVRVIA